MTDLKQIDFHRDEFSVRIHAHAAKGIGLPYEFYPI